MMIELREIKGMFTSNSFINLVKRRTFWDNYELTCISYLYMFNIYSTWTWCTYQAYPPLLPDQM